jgi:hypothetical protein
VFVAWSDDRSAFVAICVLKTLVSSFVSKEVLTLEVSAFNAICVSKVPVSSLFAKVAFVAVNAVISAFNAIPVLYVVSLIAGPSEFLKVETIVFLSHQAFEL